MFRKLYIRHTDVRQPDNGTAYFGPFKKKEIETRVNDWVADMFADSGNIEVVTIPFWRRWRMYINPRAWWMTELTNMEEFGNG